MKSTTIGFTMQKVTIYKASDPTKPIRTFELNDGKLLETLVNDYMKRQELITGTKYVAFYMSFKELPIIHTQTMQNFIKEWHVYPCNFEVFRFTTVSYKFFYFKHDNTEISFWKSLEELFNEYNINLKLTHNHTSLVDDFYNDIVEKIYLANTYRNILIISQTTLELEDLKKYMYYTGYTFEEICTLYGKDNK